MTSGLRQATTLEQRQPLEWLEAGGSEHTLLMTLWQSDTPAVIATSRALHVLPPRKSQRLLLLPFLL